MPAKLLAICILNLLIYYQVINGLLLHSCCDMWWVILYPLKTPHHKVVQLSVSAPVAISTIYKYA